MRFGWKPEFFQPQNETRWSKSKFKGTTYYPNHASVVAGFDLDECILDQGNTGSCVAQSLASAVRIVHGSQTVRVAEAIDKKLFIGKDWDLSLIETGSSSNMYDLIKYPLPSRRWIYRLARETHNDQDNDDGTYISAGIHVLATLGWPSEVHVPWDEKLINDSMSVTNRRHAIDQKEVVKEYAITSWGDDRISQIKHACVLGYPIQFGAYVDPEFMECVTWRACELKGQSLGGHAMVIIGYSSEGVHVLNSWGSNWGLGGIGLLSWDAAGKRIRDLRVITLTNEPTT